MSRTGGPGAEPAGGWPPWLVSDERSELCRELRALSAAHGLQPTVAAISIADLGASPGGPHQPPHLGDLLRLPTASAAWAPEFWAFPAWAAPTSSRRAGNWLRRRQLDGRDHWRCGTGTRLRSSATTSRPPKTAAAWSANRWLSPLA